jgi:Aerotolerance regulator N-terminal
MSVSWIAPAALIGLGLVALPIMVHLLARHHARVLAYPSLRFLRETQLAALRRRSIQDAGLLTCRIAIVATAALALAGPVLQTPARTASHAKRMSRAIVTLDLSDRSAIAAAAEGALTSATFTRPIVADALADAARWLDRQPPSAREIVVIGDLRRGVIDDSDLALVPPQIGLRFVPLAMSPQQEQAMPILARREGVLTRIDRQVRFDAEATRVSETGSAPVPVDLVTIAAAPQDADLAAASLRAALDAGVPWTDFERRVVIMWDGAPQPSPASRAQVVRMPVPSPPASAADAVRDVLAGVSRPDLKEPVATSAEQLARWTRAPGAPSPDAPLSDEGDRRWLWAAALVLLGLEWRLRSASVAKAASDVHVEARVA